MWVNTARPDLACPADVDAELWQELGLLQRHTLEAEEEFLIRYLANHSNELDSKRLLTVVRFLETADAA